jgi:low temperature requirement protein LtrA
MVECESRQGLRPLDALRIIRQIASMNPMPPSSDALHHHARRMGRRDPNQLQRVATPLELLFDLTFVIAFGLAVSQFAHALAEGHLRTALIGFGFASFAISWAWINFSWFSSAYDTDDWIFRVVTMVQMIGVLVLAIGLPRMFGSLERGNHLDNSAMVLGYVIMRIAMVFQWLRAARQDPARRRSCPPMLPPSQSPSLAGSRRSFLICRSACP